MALGALAVWCASPNTAVTTWLEIHDIAITSSPRRSHLGAVSLEVGCASP